MLPQRSSLPADLAYLLLNYFEPVKLVQLLNRLNSTQLNRHFADILATPALIIWPGFNPNAGDSVDQIIQTRYLSVVAMAFKYVYSPKQLGQIYKQFCCELDQIGGMLSPAANPYLSWDQFSSIWPNMTANLEEGDILVVPTGSEYTKYYFSYYSKLDRLFYPFDFAGVYSQYESCKNDGYLLPIQATTVLAKYRIDTIDQLQQLYPEPNIIGLFLPLETTVIYPQLKTKYAAYVLGRRHYHDGSFDPVLTINGLNLYVGCYLGTTIY